MALPSLRKKDVNDEMVARIGSLGTESARVWGKLSCGQMLAHCQKPFQVAFGEMQVKRNWIGKLFGGMAKRKFVDTEAPFNRNSPTDPRFLEADPGELEPLKRDLVQLVERFGSGESVISVHPFFGTLTPEEWDRLMWKHLDHHLRQFSA